MSVQGKPTSQYISYLLVGVAVITVASLRAGPVLIPLFRLAIMLSVPVLFVGLGMAIAGRGNRLLWLVGNASLGGLGWLVLGGIHADTSGDVWRDAGMLLVLIACPLASLVGAWLLARFHPARR